MKTILTAVCLMLTLGTASAQTVKEVADSVKSATKKGNVKEMVSTVADAFAAKAASAEHLVGTWHYVEPAVLIDTGNLLKRAAGNAAAGQLEKLLKTYIEKSNITPANTTFTFHENGTYERDVVGHKGQGVWMVNNKSLFLAIQNVQTADILTHVNEDGSVMFVVDVNKILTIMQALGAFSDSKTNKALVKLSKTIKDVKGGITMKQ